MQVCIFCFVFFRKCVMHGAYDKLGQVFEFTSLPIETWKNSNKSVYTVKVVKQRKCVCYACNFFFFLVGQAT